MKLLLGMASAVPSDAIVRLHLKLLALLRDTLRPDYRFSSAVGSLGLLEV